MAKWISSKLKVAETLLQQIDQQAAESLGKNNEKPQQSPSSSDNNNEIPKKLDPLPPPPPPLKYQLPKKSPPSQSQSPSPSPSPSSVPPPPLPSPDLSAVDDWTELLSSPNPPTNNKPNFKKPSISIPPALNKKKENEKSDKKEEEEEEESGSSSLGSEDSGTDSEEERERRRRRREQIIKERAAAAVAAKAIKDREDAVARLEGEKESLEKVLEEREKQQAQEATELQMNMIETMEAVELEKQKHNSTRMEAFARLAELETTNAELARSLATAQWNIEVEVNRVLEFQQQIELKELAQEEHKRRVLKIHQKRSSPSKEGLLNKNELQQEVFDAEYSFVCNNIVQLKDKAKMLEENIERTRRESVFPSEVEVELKRRLTQLTDHLIQKQSQVESLSSEKATLSLRIEMVSRLLDESGLSLQTTDISNDSSLTISSTAASPRFDIEAATWQRHSISQTLHERIRSGQIQLGSLVRQLDIIFSAGAIFIRRNPKAQLWSLLYILCLHVWVVYILFSPHSKVSDNAAGNGAVFSLETINKTSGS